LWGGDVWDGAVKRLVVITWLLVWAATTYGMSVNVNKLAASVLDGLAAPKPPSQVIISCSGRVSISGYNGASGATLIPRPSRAHDLVTMAEVDSGRLTSLGRVTTGVGSVCRGARAKPNSLGKSSRPSWLGISVLMHDLLSNTCGLPLESTEIFWCRFTLRLNTMFTTMQCKMHVTNR